MSNFKTTIPVSVAGVIKQLPPRSFVVGAVLNASRDGVEIVWGCDDLKTGYTFPVEFPVANLEAKRLPEGVKAAGSGAEGQGSSDEKAPEPAAVNDKVEVDTVKKGGRKGKT